MIDKERENSTNSELKQNKAVNIEMTQENKEDTLTFEENQVVEDAINEIMEEDIKSELGENISESLDEVKEDSNNMNDPSHTPSEVITEAEIQESSEQISEGDLEAGNSEVEEQDRKQDEEEVSKEGTEKEEEKKEEGLGQAEQDAVSPEEEVKVPDKEETVEKTEESEISGESSTSGADDENGQLEEDSNDPVVQEPPAEEDSLPQEGEVDGAGQAEGSQPVEEPSEDKDSETEQVEGAEPPSDEEQKQESEDEGESLEGDTLEEPAVEENGDVTIENDTDISEEGQKPSTIPEVDTDGEEEVEEDPELSDDPTLYPIDTPSTLPELEEDKETGVDIEYDYEGNAVSVFASTDSRSNNATLQDARLPAGVNKPAGTVSHFGDTKGGVAFRIINKIDTVEKGRYQFQGTAKASLVFTGGILDAKAVVSVVSSVSDGKIEIKTDTTSVTGTIREFMIKAANEKIDEINNPNRELTSAAIDDRTHLVLALSAVLAANNGEDKKGKAFRLSFKDLDSFTPRQVTLNYLNTAIFNTSLDFVRNIINENSLVNNLNGTVGPKNKSNVNLNAEGIAINLDFKVENPQNGLNTDTRYEFIGTNKDMVFYTSAASSSIPSNTSSSISYLEGFTLTQFKTGRRLPLFEAYCVSSPDNKIELISTIALASVINNTTANSYLVSNIDFNTIKDKTYIHYDHMVSIAASNIAMKIGGTSIRFNTFKIFDQDNTITKMEIEDDRLNRYPVSLSPIDENNPNSGAYPQVTGLQRSTPYLFRKLHITAKPEDELITKTLELVTISASGTTATAIAHNISIRTANFTEPKLFIEWDPDKAYVKHDDASFSSTGSSSTHTQVFIPKTDVELPNKIKMPAVKNDKTALRYVIEVDNTDVEVKDLTVNGLKGDEQYKVEKVKGDDKTYFILTLFNLSENRDYGFLILELSYVDLDGRELITRQVLSNINVITPVTVTINGASTLKYYPDATLDNTTGPELMGNDIFNVTLFEAKTLEARKAEIPVFIDDINGNFLRMEFKSPEGNPGVKAELDGSLLRFTNLEPKTEVVYKLDFIWRDKGGKEQTLSKYAKISTPQVPAVDVKGTKIKTTDKTAEIVFELYSTPKSSINSITLNNDKIKFKWDTPSLTLTLSDLKPDTEYKDLEIVFKLENGLTTRYKIDQFATQKEVKPPTGKVAEFVSRVYVASLGREPEVDGWKFWVGKLESHEISATQFIYDVIRQEEFVDRYLSKEDFIKMMYNIIVNRDPDPDGQKYWEGKYDEYRDQSDSISDVRIRIAAEMMNEQEFKDYVKSIGLKY